MPQGLCDRGQWIDEENPIRAIDAFVDALDLRDLGFDGIDPGATGRPSFHPSVLLICADSSRPNVLVKLS